MTKLSVIVPVYNVEKYLRQCIESILNQSYTEFELVLVDDGSKDSSGEICDFYKEQDSRVKVIHKVNEGLVNARKTGIQNASGQYVTYVDSDDWIDEDMYEVMMRRLLEEDADVITCAIRKEGNDGYEIIKNKILSGVYEGDAFGELLHRALYSGEFFENGLFPSLCTKIYKKEILFDNQMRVNGALRMGEDAMCTYPTLLDCSKVIVLNEFAPYHYRRTDSTMSNTYDPCYFDGACILLRELDKVFTEKESEAMLEQLQMYSLFIIGMGVRQEFSLKRLNVVSAIRRYKEIEEKYETKELMARESIEKLPELDKKILGAFYKKKYVSVVVYIIIERIKMLIKH